MGCTSSSLHVVDTQPLGGGTKRTRNNKTQLDQHKSAITQGVSDDTITIATSQNSYNDNNTIQTINHDHKNTNIIDDRHNVAAIELQAFFRASICRIRVSNHVQQLIDELLAQRAVIDYQQPFDDEVKAESDADGTVTSKTAASVSQDATMGTTHQDGDDVFDALHAAELEDHQEQGLKSDTDADAAAVVDDVVDDEFDYDTDQQLEIDGEPNPNQLGGTENADLTVEVVGVVVVVEEEEEPSPRNIRSLTFVNEEEQRQEIERAEEGLLPSWWMKFVLHTTLSNDTEVEDNGVVTTSTDFNLARSRFG
jgi:hypothetical protein